MFIAQSIEEIFQLSFNFTCVQYLSDFLTYKKVLYFPDCVHVKKIALTYL